jgi:glycosyltransferase involved in cell wall biosynthesis
MIVDHPIVDVNLFVRNGAGTIDEVIDSVLTQNWPAIHLTVIDNASTDSTCASVARIARADHRVSLLQNSVDIGPVLNCQRVFWHGKADFVLPKTADDLLAPDFVAAIMDRMLANPGMAMCHSAGLVFGDDRAIGYVYPPVHCLEATDRDPLARARTVMASYTSAPAFWGVYRRTAVDQLAPIAYRAGWDHAVLAELALYGEIGSIPELLFWRRHGGKDVASLARGCSQFAQRGHRLDDALADLLWRMPLITTAYGHVERFAVARIGAAERRRLMEDVGPIFRARWLAAMRREAVQFRQVFTGLLEVVAAEHGACAVWAGRQVAEALTALASILPDEDISAEQIALQAVTASAYSS